MPVDNPVYPGETKADLSAAVLTSSGCTYPERAIDDDPETAAVFGAADYVTDTAPTITATGAGNRSLYFAVTEGDPTTRFLKVDFGKPLFVSRIRLRLSGVGQGATGIDFVSELSYLDGDNPPDLVPLPYIPLWSDDGMHSVDLGPPLLARGVVVYPDALRNTAGLAPAAFPVINLLQLQVYELFSEGENNMPLPTSRRVRVGVQSVALYPWNGATGPYDATTKCTLEGLNELDISIDSKSAEVRGGETVQMIDMFETERTETINVKASKMDLRSFNLLFGGALTVGLAAGNQGEIQYVSENYTDRAPAVRLIAASTNGDGADNIVICKLKVMGKFGYQLNKDNVTIFDLNLVALWDATYVRQDGQIGGIRELLYTADKTTAYHS